MNEELENLSDGALLEEISRRFNQKNASITEMEFLTKKMIQLNEQAKAAESLQSGFLSLIKNEFNNPMSVLLLLSKKLSKGATDEDSIVSMASMIRRELLRLDFQLKNIFAVTEIEAGDIANNLSYIDFNAILEDAKDAVSYIIEEKEVEFIIENNLDEKFVSDRNKFYMILVNLLSNAVEFSYPKENISIHVRNDDSTTYIEVTNHGEGMENVVKNEVYNRFTQFHVGDTRESSGLGLGLSVVRSFVDSLEGEVDYSCEKGVTKFWVILPMITENSDNNVDSDDVFFDDFDDDGDTVSL